MNFQAIILDFDGTIVESVGIKDLAFKDLFKDYPEHLDEIMNYHLSHNATIRYEKFKYINEKILKDEYSEEIKKKLSDSFSTAVVNKIIECPCVDGAEEFFEFFYNKIPLYLASVSPENELKRILAARNLTKYFRKVYAYPWFKIKVIKDIMDKEQISAKEIVFIGDTVEDYQSASSLEAFFIGREGKKPLKNIKAPVYENFNQISDFLTQYINFS